MNEIIANTGFRITLFLALIPIAFALVLIAVQLHYRITHASELRAMKKMKEHIDNLTPEEIEALKQRQKELDFKLTGEELATEQKVSDPRGIITKADPVRDFRFLERKRKEADYIKMDPKEKNLILWFLASAIFWLLWGTTVGEYLGIKFVAPDVDHVSWLSFGRLRPVHTNTVFWGWASMAMVGLSYFVVPRVGNTKIYSLKAGYATMILMNANIFFGDITVMAGINNGGGEYREYIWPIMGMFVVGIGISIWNHLKTIATRKSKDIYVSNWYIVAAMFCISIIGAVGYLPFWQHGLGETITQGYYMHMAVGMWFMFFCLGLMYYFLPQELNSPVYSYSLSVLAFWTQILFYTLIGTHHFIFSPIPWWLQTIAIISSFGMAIPVTAGAANFMLTIRGSWHRVRLSYIVPFYIVGVIFYWTGSMQGSVEALRSANLVWHFTDFTTAHSHLTMYGIVTIMLFGFIYTLIPRITKHEPPSIMVGLHFWFALIGVIVYTFSLMIGATEKGMMWMDKKPFIDSVIASVPYWVWRAVGGTMMYISHFIFAYNFYRMIFPKKKTVKVPETPSEILEIVEAQKA